MLLLQLATGDARLGNGLAQNGDNVRDIRQRGRAGQRDLTFQQEIGVLEVHQFKPEEMFPSFVRVETAEDGGIRTGPLAAPQGGVDAALAEGGELQFFLEEVRTDAFDPFHAGIFRELDLEKGAEIDGGLGGGKSIFIRDEIRQGETPRSIGSLASTLGQGREPAGEQQEHHD